MLTLSINHLRRILIFAIVAAFPFSAAAGSNTATLTCVRAGTAFQFKGTIPATEEGLDLIFTDDAGSLKISADEYDASVVKKFSKGVFQLKIMHLQGEEEISLYSLPSTMRSQDSGNATKATFEAVLKNAPAIKPARRDGNRETHEKIRLLCSYSYSI